MIFHFIFEPPAIMIREFIEAYLQFETGGGGRLMLRTPELKR